MKNITKYLLAVFVVATYSCNDTRDTSAQLADTSVSDTVAVAMIDTTVSQSTPTVQDEKEEIEIAYADSIDFNKYHVDVQEQVHAPIDWTSYPEAKDFRTRITEAYKTDEVDFAGYYVMSIFGCGASCIMGFMVDVRDGKIYDLPLGEENSCLFAEDRALGNATSRLFIAGVCKENLEDTKVYYKAYLWNEDKKEFEKVEPSAFLKK